KRRRQSVAGTHLATADSQLTAKPHRTDVELVRFLDDPRFQGSQFGRRICVFHIAKKLLLGKLVADGSVAADADAEEPRPAALALRLPDGVQGAGTDSFQIAVETFAVDGGRQRILSTHVLAAAAFENQTDLHVLLAMLMPVENGTAGAEVIAAVP